jgi:hypothetical protein
LARDRAAVVFFLLLLTGCATTNVAPPAQSFVTLEQDGEWWNATWTLAAPARELRFERLAAGFRAEAFEVLTPGYAFARDGEHEVLRTSGEPASTIRVRFKEFTRHLPKDYEFFQKFSDGSVAIYTGHLLVNVDGAMVRDFRFGAPQMVVGGTLRQSRSTWTRASWRDVDGQGTYVYFGAIEPVQSEQTISIVDSGLPDWLENTSRHGLPQLFELYTRKLGARLADRPTVLFSWKESEQTGFFSSGGTLPGLIQLGIEGTGWKTESDDGLREIFHFLAHEAAHLWNGQIIHYPDEEDAWMHEGSADGLAERTLLDMGMIDEARFLAYQTAALNQCRRGLGTHPLRTAGSRQKFELYYSCGNAIALLTEASTRGDLFDFWRALIAHTLQQDDKQYEAEDYYAVMRASGATDTDIATLRALVEKPADPDALVNALRERGVQLATVDEPPQDHGQLLARDALFHLLGGVCKGSYGFNTSNRGFILNTPLNCEGLNAGEIVTAVGGHDVLRAGHRAWDELHARCGTSQPVEVTSGGRAVGVPCTKAVPARLPYVRITARP